MVMAKCRPIWDLWMCIPNMVSGIYEATSMSYLIVSIFHMKNGEPRGALNRVFQAHYEKDLPSAAWLLLYINPTLLVTSHIISFYPKNFNDSNNFDFVKSWKNIHETMGKTSPIPWCFFGDISRDFPVTSWLPGAVGAVTFSSHGVGKPCQFSSGGVGGLVQQNAYLFFFSQGNHESSIVGINNR